MPNLITDFKIQLDDLLETVIFQQTMDLIELLYDYTPCDFTNGEGDKNILNEAGSNEGSCKLFYFAKLHEFSEKQTLSAFGQFYRHDVLENPEGSDHANIRHFMRFGWEAIKFSGEPLSLKAHKQSFVTD